MIKANTIENLRNLLSKISSEKKIGFVPTMGALHSGHATLIKKARDENDYVIVSIFVNPTQFNEKKDYESYPNTLTMDIELLEKFDVDCLFLPEEKTMYPTGYDFAIHPNHAGASILEGQARPGHFIGMLTIVMKLLLLIQPNKAYFGEKDFQQVMLVDQMVKSFFLPTVIVRCPTQREASGLPFSSRNARLNQVEKNTIERIYQILQKENFSNLPILADKIKECGVSVEYLEEIEERIFLAMRIGKTRLIDNFSKETGPC